MKLCASVDANELRKNIVFETGIKTENFGFCAVYQLFVIPS